MEDGLQLAQQGRHPARVVEVRHVVRAAGLQVHEQRGLAADLVDRVQRDGSRDVRVAVDDGHEMDDGVCRPADGL